MIYVDEFCPCVGHPGFPFDETCQMIADSLLELHAFAQKLQIKPGQFKKYHYDLVSSQRKRAILAGACIDIDEFRKCWAAWKEIYGRNKA